jgi:beta-N-acetylhexosaminidase
MARPATLSHRWLTEILRNQLGYRGVVVSDDLDMKAIADNFEMAEVVIGSLRAGADCFLACRDPKVQTIAEEALERAAHGEGELRRRCEESFARLRAFRATLRPPPARDAWKRLALEQHAALAARMAQS